ncbi:alpha/beta fold hydrolase [Frankia sp. Ag45/Mut15]|uniref:Alpha/beta fold hydrolase n=1 Tax=Frankia umida TaxID=573489 RepID=A0ABT0JST2_9ACTN|nr:alpha/beta fold hydrolase [Frankia umida]MCK9874625.1 alpha/beta fold hydrolase [Frankia umida]
MLPELSGHLILDWSAPCLSSFYRALAASFRLLRFDLPGTGLSLTDASPYTVDMHLAYVDDVLDAAGCESTAIVAAGLSGPIAIAYAAQRPERVSRLVLVGTCARYCGPAADGLIDPEMPDILGRLIQTNWRIANQALTSLLLPNADAALASWVTEHRISTMNSDVAVDIVSQQLRADVRGQLAQVQAPTLVVHHRDAQQPNPALARTLAERLPAGVLDLRPGSADNPVLADPAAVVAAVRRFLQPERHLLTRRETAVLSELARGLSNRRIAAELGIAESTVARHIANVFQKLGVDNRVAAVTRGYDIVRESPPQRSSRRASAH